jgi:hypothetical protein
MESLSHSLVEQASESLTLSRSQVIVGVSTGIEAGHMIEAETTIENVMYLDNSETLVTQIATRTMLPTITWVYSKIMSESVAMISSVVLSLTFMVVRMPVHVTVISRFAFALETQTGIVPRAVSNASLIGGISSAVIVVVAFVVVILRFVRQQQTDESQWDYDWSNFDSDLFGFRQIRPSEVEKNIKSLDEPMKSEDDQSGDFFMIDEKKW